MKLYHIISTKRAAIKLDERTDSIASTMRSATERFWRGRPRKYRLESVQWWLIILRASIYNSVLGSGHVRQALCILLSVFLCEFLFALLLLCEHGRHMRSILWVRLRSRLLKWIMREVGGAAVTKVQRDCNQMAVDWKGDAQ